MYFWSLCWLVGCLVSPEKFPTLAATVFALGGRNFVQRSTVCVCVCVCKGLCLCSCQLPKRRCDNEVACCKKMHNFFFLSFFLSKQQRNDLTFKQLHSILHPNIFCC